MQKISRDFLVNKSVELLENGTVDRVLGWKRGEFDYDITPAIFRNANDLDAFVWSDFCSSNLSKYLVAETSKSKHRILVFLKSCDTYSFNQLISEHRIDRTKVYAIAIPCNGMLSTAEIRRKAEGILSVTDNGDIVTVSTLYNGDIDIERSELLLERCSNCKPKSTVTYDEDFCDCSNTPKKTRFAEVERIENMSPDERFAFWQSQLSRCIRCNACRDICPACTCEKCVFDNPSSGIESKAPSDNFEEKMFHIIRAFHVAGRCTDCGECSRVCPQSIPLHLLNRKFIKDINNFYGEYQAGAEIGNRSPLVNYTVDDIEPDERGKFNA